GRPPRAVREIDEAPVGTDVDGASCLPQLRCGIAQRVLDEKRFAGKPGRGVALVGVKLVLALDRDVNPGLRRMEVEVSRAELHAVAGLDRGNIAKHAVLEAEHLDRAGIDRTIRWRVVAARYQDHLPVVRRGEDLVGKNSSVEFFRLIDAL